MTDDTLELARRMDRLEADNQAVRHLAATASNGLTSLLQQGRTDLVLLQTMATSQAAIRNDLNLLAETVTAVVRDQRAIADTLARIDKRPHTEAESAQALTNAITTHTQETSRRLDTLGDSIRHLATTIDGSVQRTENVIAAVESATDRTTQTIGTLTPHLEAVDATLAQLHETLRTVAGDADAAKTQATAARTATEDTTKTLGPLAEATQNHADILRELTEQLALRGLTGVS